MRRSCAGIELGEIMEDWRAQQAGDRAGDWIEYACSLATPLYGGGVRPGVIDETQPIRAAGLRGQLRFWWRIANGPFESSQEMFQRESAIWGGIASNGPAASKVVVRVEAEVPTPQQGTQTHVTHVKDLADYPPYALILEPKANPAVLRADFTFRLGFRLLPQLDGAQRHEFQQALRWWASFGGVGARTRRGLGAVRVEGLEPVTAEEVQAKGGQLRLRDGKGETGSAGQAWKSSVDRLQQFRQGEGVGRNRRGPGEKTPGRSLWPEPDAIRRESGMHARRHAPEHPAGDVYPRAAFGLPIVFHFKDEGDPKGYMLQPNDKRNRMASPLVLRPYWNGHRWQPAALLLPGWEQALEVEVAFGNGADRPAWPRDSAERSRLASQIKPLDGRGEDPLSAFMTYFQGG